VELKRLKWKAWLTAGMVICIKLPAVLRISKYMWLLFYFFLNYFPSLFLDVLFLRPRVGEQWLE